MSNLVITYSKRRRKRHNDSSKDEDGTKTKIAKKVCMFCSRAEDNELEFGKICEKSDITVHYFCMRCCFCREKGATIGCCIFSCRKVFHLGCGRQNGTLHQFFGEFNIQLGEVLLHSSVPPYTRSYCDVHWPKQLLSSLSCTGVKRKGKTTCLICLSKVDTRMFWDFVQSPCCENLFHRKCLQQYALSAGLHYFKCPLCNSTKDFQKHTLQMGIYIPDQDAAWEKEANAFEELLERHSSCNAGACSCYWGRQHDADAGPFELLLCECCGSYGSHRACKGLVRSGTLLACPDCAKITDAVEKKRQECPAIEASPTLTQSSSSLHDRGCRSSNSQTNFPSTSDFAFKFKKENIVVISKEDVDSFVDILSCDSDDDISLSSNVNSMFVNCKVILERIDLKYSLQSGSLNLKNLHKRKSINHKRCINQKKSNSLKNTTILQRGGCSSTDSLESVNFRNLCKAISKKGKLGSAFKGKSQKMKVKRLSKDKPLKLKVKRSFVGIPRKTKANKDNLVSSLKSWIGPGTSRQGETSQLGLSSGSKGATALKTGYKKKNLLNKKHKFKSMWGQKTIDHYFTKVTGKAADNKDNRGLGEMKQNGQVVAKTVETRDKNHELRESEIPAHKTENILKESFDNNSQLPVQATTPATQGSTKCSLISSKPDQSSLEQNVPSLFDGSVHKDSAEIPVSLYTQSLHKAGAGGKVVSRSKDVVYVHQFNEFKEQNYREILSMTDVAAD